MCYLIITVSSSEILQPPENNTVFLDQFAIFTCVIDAGTFDWIINGTERSSIPQDNRIDLAVTKNTTSEGTTVEILTIPARAEYNGTLFQCVVFSVRQGIAAQSDNVSLMIQGNSIYSLT